MRVTAGETITYYCETNSRDAYPTTRTGEVWDVRSGNEVAVVNDDGSVSTLARRKVAGTMAWVARATILPLEWQATMRTLNALCAAGWRYDQVEVLPARHDRYGVKYVDERSYSYHSNAHLHGCSCPRPVEDDDHIVRTTYCYLTLDEVRDVANGRQADGNAARPGPFTTRWLTMSRALNVCIGRQSGGAQ